MGRGAVDARYLSKSVLRLRQAGYRAEGVQCSACVCAAEEQELEAITDGERGLRKRGSVGAHRGRRKGVYTGRRRWQCLRRASLYKGVVTLGRENRGPAGLRGGVEFYSKGLQLLAQSRAGAVSGRRSQQQRLCGLQQLRRRRLLRRREGALRVVPAAQAHAFERAVWPHRACRAGRAAGRERGRLDWASGRNAAGAQPAPASVGPASAAGRRQAPRTRAAQLLPALRQALLRARLGRRAPRVEGDYRVGRLRHRQFQRRRAPVEPRTP